MKSGTTLLGNSRPASTTPLPLAADSAVRLNSRGSNVESLFGSGKLL